MAGFIERPEDLYFTLYTFTLHIIAVTDRMQYWTQIFNVLTALNFFQCLFTLKVLVTKFSFVLKMSETAHCVHHKREPIRADSSPVNHVWTSLCPKDNLLDEAEDSSSDHYQIWHLHLTLLTAFTTNKLHYWLKRNINRVPVLWLLRLLNVHTVDYLVSGGNIEVLTRRPQDVWLSGFVFQHSSD